LTVVNGASRVVFDTDRNDVRVVVISFVIQLPSVPVKPCTTLTIPFKSTKFTRISIFSVFGMIVSVKALESGAAVKLDGLKAAVRSRQAP